MGNSQGAQLRPTSPFSSPGDSRGFGARKHFKERRRWSGGASKFAAPENRVLPPPVAGQKLRTTNNGHILLNGGTISGRKLAMLAQEREKRNESSFEDEDYSRDLNESGDTTGPDTPGSSSKMLYGHKKSHSDPDIIHSMIRNDIVGESDHNLSRSIIAVSPSKAKIKSRKKTRAPEPPLSNTLPRDLDKIPMFGHYRKSGRIKMKADQSHHQTTAAMKSKSPAPPPPPPPSGPNAMDPQSAVYEKNKRGPTKWKMSKSSSDVREENIGQPILNSPSKPALGRMDLHRKSYGDIETKTNQVLSIFDTRNSYNAKLAEHIKPKTNEASRKEKPNLNKSFQEEIMAAVKKKSGFSETNLCAPKGTTPPMSSRIHIGKRNEQMKTTWNVELRKKEEDKQSEPDYEDVEEPITYCINEERFNQQPPWKSDSRTVNVNGAKSPRFIRNDPVRSSQIDVSLTKDLKSDQKEKTQNEYKEKMREVHSQIKIGLTEKDLRRHTEQQKDLKLVKTRENGKWIMENTQDKLTKSPTTPHQGLWANNKYPVDVENRHSLAKEIYLQQEQQKRSRNLNQIENNLYSKDKVVEKDGTCSESEYSSSSDSLKDNYEIGALMRPTLPRKSLEIPQFSPTQAWKSLIIDQPPTSYLSDLSSDEGEINEETIRQFQKPIAPRRSTVERCTDSGISPDAGSPLPNHEHRELPMHQQTRKPGVGRNASPLLTATANWIPQQDLLDDSDLGSVDQYNQQSSNLKNHHYWAEANGENGQQTKQSFPYGIFSGRQPTEIDGTYQLKIPVEKQKSRDKKKNKSSNGGQHFNSLRSLKRVFGLKMKVAEEPKEIDTNWSLSRSTPVINNEADKTLIGEVRHSPSENMLHSKSKKVLERNDSRPRSDGNMEYCIEDEEPLPTNVKSHMKNELIKENKITKMKKKNKFSYQNTIRKEEKKKIEEKLNQEVAMREQRREKEIQWMNKVEEEFRKRRDREKINIRYQLKMLNDEDASFEWDPADISAAERESRSLPYIPLHSPTTVNKINSSPIQKQVKKEFYHMNESADLRTPSTTASSPDLPQWPQSTGMSKWLRKKKSQKPLSNNKQKHHNGPMSPPRPEPEGGRSSGDEHKSMEIVKDKNGGTPINISLPNYNKRSTVYKQETPATLVNERSITNMNKNPPRDDLIRAFAEGHSVDSDCLDTFITSVEKQVKTKLANNGHTFQSHIRYDAKQVENKKVPKKHSEILNNHYLQSEVTNGLNVQLPTKELKKFGVDNSDGGVFARGHPHRSGGRAKVAPLKLSPENSGYFPQPYSPSKAYRSIPFDVVLNGDTNRNNSSSARHNAPQELRTAVEAR